MNKHESAIKTEKTAIEVSLEVGERGKGKEVNMKIKKNIEKADIAHFLYILILMVLFRTKGLVTTPTTARLTRAVARSLKRLATTTA